MDRCARVWRMYFRQRELYRRYRRVDPYDYGRSPMRLRSVLPAMALSLTCWLRAPLAAQYVGSNVKGDIGLKSATQPGPGLYISGLFYRYDVDTIRDRTGAEFGRGALDINAFAPLVWGVTKQKILGANYGIIFALPVQNAAIELPTFQADAGFGLGDMYLVPLNLGWHFSRADWLRILCSHRTL